ncbi:MAG: hypothetical protein HDS52_03235 [Barnesiella sp.]|nr:hypothetical protein [Barnesiella sp.]
MKTVNPDREYELLLNLVNRYFEGETSREEEMTLRRHLVDTDCDMPEIEEARAVMGLFATARRQQPAPAAMPAAKPKRSFPFAAVSAAASVAVIIVAVLSIMSPGSMTDGDMMAKGPARSYDSVAQYRMNNAAGHNHMALAMVTGGVNRPDTPDEIASIIGSEMGLMAEAERSVYESMEEDFTLLRDLPLGGE